MGSAYELRAEAAKIRAYLPRLRNQRDEAEEHLRQLESLLMDERTAMTALMDKADRLDPPKPKPAPKPKLPKPKIVRRKSPPVPPGMKYCFDCGDVKALDQFARNGSASDGLQSRCRPCDSTYQRERREERKAASQEAALSA